MSVDKQIIARVALAAAALSMSTAVLAADDIQVGDVIVDSPTICCLGFSVPISGDDNYDAVATIEIARPAQAPG